MLYFDTLPKILTPDENGHAIVMTNIVSRAKLMDEFKNNPMLFYEYDIQEGDTPEIVAHKYYGDSFRYWLILYANELMDPIWEWPLSQREFSPYIDKKYKDEAALASQTPFVYTNSTIHHYEKIVTSLDNVSNTTTVKKFSVDAATYAAISTSTTTYVLPTGSVTQTISKATVTLYDYEDGLNEAKRKIKIMNEVYADDFEKQFKLVMGT